MSWQYHNVHSDNKTLICNREVNLENNNILYFKYLYVSVA